MSFKMVQRFPCKAFQIRGRSKSSGSWNTLHDFVCMTSNQSTIPDKKVGTRGKFSLPTTYDVDNQVILSLLIEKNATFANIDQGGWGIRDPAQLSQRKLRLSGI